MRTIGTRSPLSIMRIPSQFLRSSCNTERLGGSFLRRIVNINAVWKRQCTSATRKRIVLGIESSCDDTACGIVSEDGSILGESINSQQEVTIR